MCFTPPRDNSAEIARAAEAERQAKVTEGRKSIDSNFARFDDDYFRGIRDNFSGWHVPQLAEKFQNARKALTYNLSRSGNLNASAGARQLGDLRAAYEKNLALIADRSIAAGNQARADVESNRSALYSQLSASADPAAAATSSVARASALSAPPVYSPLADVFSSFLNQTSNQILGATEGGYKNLASSTGLFKPKGSTVNVPS